MFACLFSSVLSSPRRLYDAFVTPVLRTAARLVLRLSLRSLVTVTLVIFSRSGPHSVAALAYTTVSESSIELPC